MAIDSVNKRRNIGGVYYVPDGAIDTEAERKAVAFIYKTAVIVLNTPVLIFNAKSRIFRFLADDTTWYYNSVQRIFRFTHNLE